MALTAEAVRISAVEKPHNLPDAEKLSILTATILLGYALAHFLNLPERTFAVQLPGLYLSIPVNTRTIITLLVVGLAASGTNWLLEDHPAARRHRLYQHWALPALTAWVIGFPINQLPFGSIWIASFFIGGTILVLVLIAEYITIDPDDFRQPLAASGLTAVSFSIYFMVAIALHYTGFRLILVLPAVLVAGGLVSLRTLQMRLHGRWTFFESGSIALVGCQLAAALHYLPLSPVSFGLALLGPTYSLTSFVANMAEGSTVRQSFLEPLIILVLIWGIAIWLR